MKETEFLLRELRITSDDGLLEVIRTRTSGSCKIQIRNNCHDTGSPQVITFTDKNLYESQARELIKLLEHACDNYCLLTPFSPNSNNVPAITK